MAKYNQQTLMAIVSEMVERYYTEPLGQHRTPINVLEADKIWRVKYPFLGCPSTEEWTEAFQALNLAPVN